MKGFRYVVFGTCLCVGAAAFIREFQGSLLFYDNESKVRYYWNRKFCSTLNNAKMAVFGGSSSFAAVSSQFNIVHTYDSDDTKGEP